jgi:hypothetical protein
MVMGWFCALILGEKKVCNAADARRSAEEAAQSAASKSSGSYCAGGGGEPGTPGLPNASVNASIVPNGKPDAQRAISAIAGLGIGGQPTFPYYTLPLQNVRVKASSQAQSDDGDNRSFFAERSLGCLERPLDMPTGQLDAYRLKIWVTNLMGY